MEGKCNYRGEVMSIAEAGWRGAKDGWDEASIEEKKRRKEGGRKGGWDLQTVQDKERICEEGIAGGSRNWTNASEEEKSVVERKVGNYRRFRIEKESIKKE